MEPEKKWLAALLDAGFTPIECQDLKVEKIRLHPSDYAEMRKHLSKETFDQITEPELLKLGHRGNLFGAVVEVDKTLRPKHYELFDSMQGKHVVCATKARLTGEDCGDMECLVDAVHAF